MLFNTLAIVVVCVVVFALVLMCDNLGKKSDSASPSDYAANYDLNHPSYGD